MRSYARVRQLSDDEREACKKMSRARKLAAGRVKRAKIVVRSDQGYTRQEISEKLDICQHTVSRWIKRFTKLGMAGLEEGPRGGRPRVYSSQEVGTVIEIALTPPEPLDLPCASWTLDRIVAYVNEDKGIAMKRSRVSDILRHEGLRWRKQEGWFGERVDPEAEQRGRLNASTPNHPRTVS